MRPPVTPRPGGPPAQVHPFAVASRRPEWVPRGVTVRIGPHVIQGGMLYVGPVPRDVHESNEMPESIDPALPIDDAHPDHAGVGLPYWPAYHSISPRSRSAYLSWLAGGRSAPDACIGYVFLYFYGLERRVLLDAVHDPVARVDVRWIYTEVLRLLRVYGGNSSFHSYASEFQHCLELLLTTQSPNPPASPPDPATTDKYPTPFALALGLGVFARDGLPVPAEWAHSWALLNPEIYPRTPAARCPEEFRRLFATRYAREHGNGLVIDPVRPRLSVEYRPASSDLDTTLLELSVPDVVTEPVATRALAQLVAQCTTLLDAYSRLIGRQPEARNTLAAVALLPAELLDHDAEALRPLRDLVQRTLGPSVGPVVVESAELIAVWPSRVPGKFAKADAVSLAQLLERLGLGVEPDVRMGGPVLSGGPAVLFRATDELPTTPSHEYTAATTLLHLAAVVSAADDDVSEIERAHLIEHLESALHLSAGERLRLTAHLALLLASDTKLTGLKKRLTALSRQQRDHVADFLTMVAAIDGHISPAEVKTLRKIYTLLELDPESVYAKLHVSAAGPPPATAPVTIETGDGRPTGFLIPRPESAPAGQIVLDRALVEQKLAETAAVSALLADIFVDEPEEPAAPAPAGVVLVAGLDPAHSAFARRIADRPEWTRQEIEQLCAEMGLMLEGALDAVNEAALDAADELLVEGEDDVFLINDYARGGLLV
ncbi:TerB N-terminal domain-containing protein [Lentzea sp. NEAU-D7]|uniref:tellurite resistance TerB family protein n=1 Tax=Lentzea sp. NEAU-D7 TaxID=2994667 RepID=UPI00224B32DA|nr:TerB N-terminal domain-containing protein [Lentzea sp. NEAU-D7]MCX2949690.1 TerB N-terminal domain-containing protein [Lentzea sp. NEAU-D7]